MKKKTNFLFLIVLFLVFSTSFVYAYNDVSSNHWAYTAIMAMEEKEILHGYPDGNFYPNNNVRREEFAKIIVTALQLTEKEVDIKYEDIGSNRWSKDYIEIGGKYFTSYKHGGKHYFMPTEYYLREDVMMTTVLALGLENSEYDLKILEQFKDKKSINQDIEKYVAIAIENELISGYPDGTLNPKGRLTRAEVSQFMYNLLLRLEEGDLEMIAEPNESGEVVVEKVKLENSYLRVLLAKESCVLNAKIIPSKATKKEITWTSSDESVAKIDKNGKITPKSIGTTTITAMSSNGQKDTMTLEIYVLKYDEKILELGQTEQIVYSHSKLHGFKSSNPKVATVDQKGNVKAVGIGQCDITFLDNSQKESKCKIIVQAIVLPEIPDEPGESEEPQESQKPQKPQKPSTPSKPASPSISVEKVDIKYSNLHISLAQENYKLEVSVTPTNATNKQIKFSSSNDSIATIDKDGKITPKAVGNVRITATSLNGKKDTMLLEIYALRFKEKVLDIGRSELIVHGADKLKDFKSDNVEVATVDQKGIVTAVGAGECNITLKDNNDKVLNCKIIVEKAEEPDAPILPEEPDKPDVPISPEEPVVPDIPVTNVDIKYPNLHLSLAQEDYKLEVSVTPANATNKEIIFSSSDEKIATIDKEGKITTKAVGEVVITAASSNGVKDTMALEVYALRFDKQELEVGQSEIIVHGANKLKNFKSSNVNVATVDQEGNVTAKNPGEATIMFQDANDVTLECIITVKLGPIVLELSPDKGTFKDGETMKLIIKSGKLLDGEVLIWEFYLDDKQIATHSGNSMQISQLIRIATVRYGEDFYGKEITLKAFPRSVKTNTDRESTEFKIVIEK